MDSLAEVEGARCARERLPTDELLGATARTNRAENAVNNRVARVDGCRAEKRLGAAPDERNGPGSKWQRSSQRVYTNSR